MLQATVIVHIRNGRRWKQLGLADHHVQDTTALNTFVPADYTVECSDEMPMDDASASDNCSEVTMTDKCDNSRQCCGQLHHCCAFTATDEAGNNSSAIQTITVQDNTALGSPSSLPTTP